MEFPSAKFELSSSIFALLQFPLLWRAEFNQRSGTGPKFSYVSLDAGSGPHFCDLPQVPRRCSENDSTCGRCSRRLGLDGETRICSGSDSHPLLSQQALARLSSTGQADQIVYSPRLPSAQEIAARAAAQGLALQRIEQISTEVTALYRTPTGESIRVCYLPLPAARSSSSTIATTTPPLVLRAKRAPRVVYYDPYPYNGGAHCFPFFSAGFGYDRSFYLGNRHLRSPSFFRPGGFGTSGFHRRGVYRAAR